MFLVREYTRNPAFIISNPESRERSNAFVFVARSERYDFLRRSLVFRYVGYVSVSFSLTRTPDAPSARPGAEPRPVPGVASVSSRRREREDVSVAPRSRRVSSVRGKWSCTRTNDIGIAESELRAVAPVFSNPAFNRDSIRSTCRRKFLAG